MRMTNALPYTFPAMSILNSNSFGILAVFIASRGCPADASYEKTKAEAVPSIRRYVLSTDPIKKTIKTLGTSRGATCRKKNDGIIAVSVTRISSPG